MIGEDLWDLFRENVTVEGERKLLRAAFSAHREAGRICEDEFEDPEIENVAGFVRRAKLEGAIRSAATLIPGAHAITAKSEGNWNHVELRAGPVVMTANAVPTPCAMVEIAGFRLTLAEDNQLRMFPVPGVSVPTDAPLYAILLHSRFSGVQGTGYKRYRSLPGSVYIGFPNASLTAYAHAVNLFDEHPDLVQELLPRDWDEEVRLRYVAAARVRGVA